MAVVLDVVVDVRLREPPLAHDEALGGQRAQRRTIEPLEELAPARTVRTHRALVQLVVHLGDRRVQFLEREEGAVAKARQDPALRDLHADLDLRLVLRARRPRRQHRRPVVPRKLLVRALDLRVVPARLRHAALQLLAPSTATKSSTSITSPVFGSTMLGFLPEKSTKSFSPA